MAYGNSPEMKDTNWLQQMPMKTNGDANDPRCPLIEQATNQWQKEQDQREYGLGDPNGEESYSSCAQRYLNSPRVWKMFVLLCMFILVIWWPFMWGRRQLKQEWEIKEGFMVQENGTYGIAKGGHFDGDRLHTLDAKLVPGGVDDPEGQRRLVFIGDIHGCAHELKKLLKRIDFDERTDHLIAVGDTISKGPENVEVLDKLIELDATSVRGNHEDRILALAPSILQNSVSQDVSEASSKGAKADAKLLRSLSKHHLRFLEGMPLMLRVPALPMADKPSHKESSPLAEEILVVHAGLVPAVSLEKQDPFFVMNMRAIKTKSHLPLIEAASKKTKSQPWHDLWGWYNDRLFRKKSLKDFQIWDDLEMEDQSDSWLGLLGLASKKKWPKPQVVVYGHHAKAGLQFERWSKGLDTGCVRGGKLTAMVLDARGRQELVSVGCKDHR